MTWKPQVPLFILKASQCVTLVQIIKLFALALAL